MLRVRVIVQTSFYYTLCKIGISINQVLSTGYQVLFISQRQFPSINQVFTISTEQFL